MFTRLPVADQVYREPDLPAACRQYARDTVTLGWEERLKIRGRRRSDGGVEFGTSLPRGTVLRSRDCLVLDDPRLVISVVERAEPVFVVEPLTPQQWGLFAYQIGNRHQPLMITERGLVCPDEPGVEEMLQHHGMDYVRATIPFTPAAAFAAHGH